ncbi:MAG: YbaB/EbfC family nucleoid-associated protein [Vicinamibacteria bacterium]|jgi:DNA-binding YbaB/EbfC family protein|nr:YbaB/EbfC family nucleoid-associated protein [Vicinamibacteria bacterium]
MNPFGNPQKLLKQLQSAQERIQREIAEMVVEASAGGGMVKVTMTGEKKVTAVAIDRQVVNPDDVEMLQDLIVAALTEASARVDEQVKDKIGSLTGGMKLPGF